MANKELVYLSDVRRALLRFEPEAVYTLQGLRRVDAVEVVRCKDCKVLCRNYAHMAQHCSFTGVPVDDDDFCSLGERRADE